MSTRRLLYTLNLNMLLRPPVVAFRKHVISADKLRAGDTPLPVLAPGEGKTKAGRLWTDVRDDRPASQETAPAVWFAYSSNRRSEHPQAHLKSFKGDMGDGRAEIDNNAAERSLRTVAPGRKNFLFAGSDAGGAVVEIR